MNFKVTSQAPLVSVIIVNLNGEEVLKECLESLRNQTFQDFEIIVVDNASRDGSVEMVRRLFPNVLLIELKRNYGFSGGNNEGLRIAKGQFIALLNNDAVAHPHWLQKLVESSLRNPKAGMWASKVLNYYKPEEIDNTGLLLYPDGIGRGRGRLEIDKGQYDNSTECLIPSGCACMFRREALGEGFDERFFAYLDDVDVGLRARFMGWECVYVPEAIVYHRYSFTTSPYSIQKVFLVERNRIWILLKYFPLDMILLSPFYTIKRLLFQFYGVISKKGASRQFVINYSIMDGICAIFKAWLSAMRMLIPMLKERNKTYKKMVISKKDIRKLLKKFQISVKELALKE